MEVKHEECVRKWEVWEASCTPDYLTKANPFIDVVLKGEFISPSGRIVRVNGFYDGSNTWKIRFCPDETGKYTACLTLKERNVIDSCYKLEINTLDPVKPGKIKINPQYPHFLITEDGSPFYVVGSGMEAHIPKLYKPEKGLIYYYPEGRDPFDEWKEYIDNLTESGFNRLRLFWAWLSFQGEEVFDGVECGFFKYRDCYVRNEATKKYDLSRFNTTSWELLDRILLYSLEKNLYVELVIFDRCCLESWKGQNRWEWHVFNEKNGGPLPEMKDKRFHSHVVSDEHLQPDKVYNGKRAFFDIMEPYGVQEDWSFQMWNLYYQKLFVDYLIARTAAYSNIYYEVMNEIERPFEKWTQYWFKYIRQNDPYNHLITISPIYNKKDGESRELFFSYYTFEENEIISLHNNMEPDDPAELNPKYWHMNKPIIYDEVFWIREKTPHLDANDQKSYDDERRWFWVNFMNGSMTQRVCWQSFKKTPVFEWIRHFSDFIQELEWWEMVPGTKEVVIKAGGNDESTIIKHECKIREKVIVYLATRDECRINELKLYRNGRTDAIDNIKIYNTVTGSWVKADNITMLNSVASICLPETAEDIVLIIE